MSETFLEHLGSMRASLDELEAAYRAAESACAHYHQVASRHAKLLGLPIPLELPALPAAPIEAQEAEEPAPARVKRQETPQAAAKPRQAAPSPAGKLVCFRSTGRDAGPCRGKVVEVCCEHAGCNWSRPLCAAHREGPREAMVLSAHHRVAHTAAGKAALRALQVKGAAARDGRPKHRQARTAKAAEPERKAKPATSSPPAVDRKALIAQRVKAAKASASKQRCLICQKPGHNARTCPRRRAEVDETEGSRPAMGALDVQGLEELDAGHDVTPRAGVRVEE